MSLANLTSAQLQRLVELIKEKESLQARLDEVVRSLEKFETGKTSPKSAPVKAGSRKPRRQRKLKERLLKLLQAAGERD